MERHERDWRKLERPASRPDIPKDAIEALRLPDAQKKIQAELVRKPRAIVDRWPDVVAFGIGVRLRNGKVFPNELVLTCLVEKKRPLAKVPRARRIDRSVTLAGVPIDTDVVELGRVRHAQTAATANPFALAQNDPPQVVPLQGGQSIGRQGAREHGSLAGVFRAWSGGGRYWVCNTHVVEMAGGTMIQPWNGQFGNYPYNEIGDPDIVIPYVVPSLFGGFLVDHLDAARGRIRLRAVDPPGFTHTIPDAPIGQLLAAGQFGGWIAPYSGQTVRKTGSRTDVSFGITLLGSGFGVPGMFPVPIPGLSAGAMVAGLSFHLLENGHGDSGSSIIDDATNQFTALYWGVGSAGQTAALGIGDTATNVVFWLELDP